MLWLLLSHLMADPARVINLGFFVLCVAGAFGLGPRAVLLGSAVLYLGFVVL